MLVAQIEIWPFGSKARRRIISTLKIANVGEAKRGAHETLSRYACVLENADRHEAWRYVWHNRIEGAGTLVRKALKAFE